jgi:uncharacterized membrane protein YebE (DUF533 family)
MLTEGRNLVRQGEDAAASRLGVGDDPGERDRMRKTALAAGAAAGVMGLLLGSGGGRKLAAIGGLGLLGKVAYDAYSRSDDRPAGPQDQPIHLVTDETAERRAVTLTHAIIAAAKADGHIDEAERKLIETQMADLPDAVRGTLATALLAPADPVAVASRATSDQERREIYAASVMAVGKDHPDELVYMDKLARALGLPPEQVAAIEADMAKG